jgi:hypothetical protein
LADRRSVVISSANRPGNRPDASGLPPPAEGTKDQSAAATRLSREAIVAAPIAIAIVTVAVAGKLIRANATRSGKPNLARNVASRVSKAVATKLGVVVAGGQYRRGECHAAKNDCSREYQFAKR